MDTVGRSPIDNYHVALNIFGHDHRRSNLPFPEESKVCYVGNISLGLWISSGYLIRSGVMALFVVKNQPQMECKKAKDERQKRWCFKSLQRLKLWIESHPGKAGVLAGWYQQACTGLIALIWVPLVIKNLGKTDAGMWFSFQGFLAIISLTDFGLSFVVSRQVAFALHAKEGQAPVVGTDLILTLPGWAGVNQIYWASRRIFRWMSVLGLALLVVLYQGVLPMGKLLDNATSETAWAWYLLGAAGLIALQAKPHLSLLDGMGRVYMSRFLLGTFQLFTSIGILVTLFMGGRLREMSTVVCFISIAQYFVVRLLVRFTVPMRCEPVSLDKDFYKKFLRIAAPMGVVFASAFLVNAIQVPLLGFLFGAATVPAFFLAQKIGQTLNLAVNQVVGPQMPIFTQQIAAGAWDEARKRLVKVVSLVTFSAFVVNILFLLLSPLLVEAWVGPAKYVSTSTLALMSLDYAIGASTSVWGQFVLASGRNPFALSTVLHGVLTFVLTVVICPCIGIVGIPLASLSAGLLTNYWFNPFHGVKLLKK